NHGPRKHPSHRVRRRPGRIHADVRVRSDLPWEPFDIGVIYKPIGSYISADRQMMQEGASLYVRNRIAMSNHVHDMAIRLNIQPSVEHVTVSHARISSASADSFSRTSRSASLPSSRCDGGLSAAIAASIARAAFIGSPSCLPLFSSRAWRIG